MPIYEYRCADCHQVFEEWLKTFDDKPKACPVCGGSAERVISNTSFVLKGGGWYVTEYGNRKPENGDGQEKKAPAAADSAPAPASDSAPAAKAAPAAGSATDAKTAPPAASAPSAPSAPAAASAQ